MTKLLEQALRQVEQLPEGEQDAAAGALLDYVKHMRDMRLTDAKWPRFVAVAPILTASSCRTPKR